MNAAALRVGIVGCGLIGHKRAGALDPDAELVGCFDVSPDAAWTLAERTGAPVLDDLDDLLALTPDVVIVAVTHDQVAPIAVQALDVRAHVLVEKPAGLSVAQVDDVAAAAARNGRLVKVGFNHRFHPAIARAVTEARSGQYGEILHLRGRYGHGGRIGYDREWRADPARSGGGELIDQGMHLLDITHWTLGDLPLHSALLRTQFWDTPADDNAMLLLGERDRRDAPWAMLHVTWTEWKNMFSLEIYCRTAKLQVDGLAASYGPQTLRIYRMKPELGPPDLEEVHYPPEDRSWETEWEHFAAAVRSGDPGARLSGDLADARYAWQRVQEAYELGGYGAMRELVPG
jgi:predicted dehydrogenase